MDERPARLITADEAAERLACCRKSIQRLCRSGELRFIPGRPVRVLEQDVEAYLRRNLIRAGAPGRMTTEPQALQSERPAISVTVERLDHDVPKPKRRGRPIQPLRLLPLK